MSGSLVLDIMLGLVLIAYIVYGFRNGFSRSVFVIAGVVAGVVGAFFLAPLAATWVPVSLPLKVTLIPMPNGNFRFAALVFF